ncbi:MAG: hypothetical protein J1E04_01510 [Alistipes sp.]|nr:hypothetical protein [Alistipes sp.]
MKKNNSNMFCSRLTAAVLSVVGLAAVSWGCAKDETTAKSHVRLPEEITFKASIDNSSPFNTRGGLIIPVTPKDFDNTVFYIYETGLHKDETNGAGTLTRRVSVRPYWLASNTEGQLDIMPKNQFPLWHYEEEDAVLPWKMNWFSADTPHIFWSWTWPMEQLDYSYVDKVDKEAETTIPAETRPKNRVLNFISSDFPLLSTPTDNNTDVETHDDGDGDNGDGDGGDSGDVETPETPEENPQTAWRNGEILNKLVGARTDRSYAFSEDGRYVPLTYKHLVSRIILGKFCLVDRTGAMREDLQARITFYGMPKRAIFFPLPEKLDEDGNPAAPYVSIDHSDPYGLRHKGKTEADPDYVTPEAEATAMNGDQAFEYNKNEYLTFYILNKGEDKDNSGGIIIDPDDPYKNHDMFYICPEVDFSKMDYKVEFVEYDKDKGEYIPHHEVGVRGGYFGDFVGVEFEREVESTSEVNGETVTTVETTSDMVLHAGEEMVLNMTVYEKSGPGAGVYIRNWNSQKLKSATYHTRPGIYSDAEAKTVRDALNTATNSAAVNQTRQDTFHTFGETETVKDEDGTERTENVIRMYSDVMIAYSTSAANYDYNIDFKMYYPQPSQGDVILDGMGYTITFVNTSTTVNRGEFKTFVIGNMRDVYISNGVDTVYINPEGKICRLNEETGRYEVSESPKDNPWVPNVTRISFATP